MDLKLFVSWSCLFTDGERLGNGDDSVGHLDDSVVIFNERNDERLSRRGLEDGAGKGFGDKVGV